MFYGMPIHIIRDVALTIRSFYKRITDFVRYRQATRDMHARYPDATAEEVAREDVCIICREDMRPWQAQSTAGADQAGAEPNSNGAAAVDERLRPKKLPCGHILHFACLRSWLERQQNCPTCRRPVLMTGTVARTQDQPRADQHGRAPPHVNQPQAQVPAHGHFEQPIAGQNVFNFGPLRIAFGARQGAHGAAQQVNNNNALPPTQPGHLPFADGAFGFPRQIPGPQTRTVASFSPTGLQLQLHQMEHQLVREINSLRVQQNQLYLVRALQGELARLRIAQSNPDASFAGQSFSTHPPRTVDTLPQAPVYANAFGASPQQQSLGSGHSSLPDGMTLPPGWSILPLQRITDGRNAVLSESPNADSSSVQSQPPGSNASDGSVSQDRSQTNVAGHTGESSSTLPGEAPSRNSDSKPEIESSGTLPEIPRRSSGLGFQVPNGAPKGNKDEIYEYEMHHDDEAKGNDPRPMSQTIADSKQIKGKGKATTVEDTPEELD